MSFNIIYCCFIVASHIKNVPFYNGTRILSLLNTSIAKYISLIYENKYILSKTQVDRQSLIIKLRSKTHKTRMTIIHSRHLSYDSSYESTAVHSYKNEHMFTSNFLTYTSIYAFNIQYVNHLQTHCY